ncbi:hypothetical protein COOONC_26773 [Cooperia oncophora]
MSHGQDEVLTCLAEEKLEAHNHPPPEPTSFTGIREEDGDLSRLQDQFSLITFLLIDLLRFFMRSLILGIVSDYNSPLKVVETSRKAFVRKGLTDKTNTDVHNQEYITSKTVKQPIEESPISSRRPPRLLTPSMISSDDGDNENVLSVSSFEETVFASIETTSAASISSFSVEDPHLPQDLMCSRLEWTSLQTYHMPANAPCHLRGLYLEASRVRKVRANWKMARNLNNRDRRKLFGPTVSSRMTSLIRGQTPYAQYLPYKATVLKTLIGLILTQICSLFQGVFVTARNTQRESLAFRSISAETLASEIRRLGPEEFERRYLLIDCRYPYEYEGGIRQGAFLKDPDSFNKRGPGMALALRSIDRMRNELNYPKVDYAEMYLLDHGYRKFWNDGYKSECVPCGYVPMTDSAHVSSLIKYKWHKSKSTSQLIVRQPLRKVSLYRHRSLMQVRRLGFTFVIIIFFCMAFPSPLDPCFCFVFFTKEIQVCTEVETTESVISPTAKTPLLTPRRLEFGDSPEWDSTE